MALNLTISDESKCSQTSSKEIGALDSDSLQFNVGNSSDSFGSESAEICKVAHSTPINTSNEEIELMFPASSILENSKNWKSAEVACSETLVDIKGDSVSPTPGTAIDVEKCKLTSLDESTFSGFEVMEERRKDLGEIRNLVSQMKRMLTYGRNITEELDQSGSSRLGYTRFEPSYGELDDPDLANVADEVSDIVHQLPQIQKARYRFRPRKDICYKE